MDQYDVEIQIADMVLKVGMNNHLKLYAFSRRRVLLDIHIQRQARRWMLCLWLPVLTQDGVHEQHFSPVHIWREFGVVDFGFLRLLVALDEDLANAN